MNLKRKVWPSPAHIRQGLLLLSVLCCVSPVWADNSATFNATVSVQSANACTVTVSPPTSTSMAATWSYFPAPGELPVGSPPPSGTLALTSSGAPPAITIKAAGPSGAGCTLNTFKVRTTMGAGVQPGPTTGGGDQFTFRMPFGTQGGFWRFMPYLANAQFYTSTDTSVPGTGTITWNSPSPGFLMTFGSTPTMTAGTIVPAVDALGGDVMVLTDEYVTDGAAYLIDNGVNEGYFTSSDSSENYLTAVLSFGALLATGPENVNGVRNPVLAVNGDSVTMSWTVYIDQV